VTGVDVVDGGVVVRVRGEGLSMRVPLRPVVVGVVLAVVTFALAVVAIGIGDYPVSPTEVVDTLLGGGTRATSFIVETLRLPRVLCAVLVGAALGISGAIFQSLTNNPLGSPDIIGFTTGSAAGALVVITIIGGSGLVISLGALVGGLLTAAVTYGLAYRRGVSGYRLVLIGIGISALGLAAIDYMLTRARIEEAVAATVWLVGSLNGRGWDQVRPLAWAMVVLVPVALLLSRPLRLLEMGDDAARALGCNVERSRMAIVLVGVALVAAGTTAAGPVGFVALAAPQLARRLTRLPNPGIVTSGLMGAALLTASDIAGQRLLGGTQLPVGLMTGLTGGVYLAWLLATERRRGHA
jgi:iron-siderophore transport system permease protein